MEQRSARAEVGESGAATAWLGDARRERALIASIVAAAFALRVVHVLAMRATPFFDHPQMDALYHVEWARAFARGEDYQPGPFFRAPLYPWFLGLLFRVFGDGLLLPRLVQCAFGAASTGLVWALGRRVFDRRTGVLAAAVLALNWTAIFFDGELLLETLAIPLYLLGMWLTLRAAELPRPGRAALAGLAWGASAITRPNVLPLLAVLAVWLWWSQRRARGIGLALAFAAGCALPIAPLAAYNRFVGHDSVLIASQGGVNLWIGNNPLSDGTSAVVPGTREDWWGGYRDAIALAEREEGRALRPSEVSRHYTDKALAFAAERPGEWLALLARKARWFAMDWELGNNEEPRFLFERFSPLAPLSWMGWGLWLALALLGGWAGRRSASRRIPLDAYVLVYSATVVLFFVNARFRLPVAAALSVFAARGVWAVLDPAIARRWLAAAAALATAALAYAGSRALVPEYTPALSRSNGHQMLANAAVETRDWAGARDQYAASVELWKRNWISWRGMARCQFELHEFDAARASYVEALRLREDDVIARSGLVSVLLAAGEDEQAEREAQRLEQLRPDSALGPHDLGRVLFRRGDWNGAAQAFRRALEREPRDFNSAYSLGRVLLELRDEAGASAAFEQALEGIEPGERVFLGDAFVQAIRLRLQRGDRSTAVELATRMRQRMAGDPQVEAFLRSVGLAN